MSASLLCKSAVKKFLLEYSEREKFHKFTRVSASAIEHIEAQTREACRRLVKSQPSKGMTISS